MAWFGSANIYREVEQWGIGTLVKSLTSNKNCFPEAIHLRREASSFDISYDYLLEPMAAAESLCVCV